METTEDQTVVAGHSAGADAARWQAGLDELLGRGPARLARPSPHCLADTPNRHVLISEKTALGVGPVSKHYFHINLRRHGVELDRIRKDRILHEALTVDPTRCT